jgi:hypothetical protein
MPKTNATSSTALATLSILLPAGALLAWLAALSLEVSAPRAGTWSAPWIGAYFVAVASALVTGRTGSHGVHQWLGYGSAVLIGIGAVVKTALPAPQPPAAAALTAVDVPLALGLGLTSAGIVLRNPLSRRDPGGPDTPVALGVGLLLAWGLALLMEYVARPNLWHGSEFYIVTGATLPLVLSFAATSSSRNWTATKAAGLYMTFILVTMWGFQAVPVPNSGPGVEHAGHLLPPPFPLALVLPALFMDSILGRLGSTSRWWWRAGGVGLAGVAFVSVMVVVHWPLADFLLSPAARNAIFGADQWPFYAELGQWRYQHWTLDPGTRRLAAGLALAVLLSACSAGVGHWLGRAVSLPDKP